jgi:hypothetical protein
MKNFLVLIVAVAVIFFFAANKWMNATSVKGSFETVALQAEGGEGSSEEGKKEEEKKEEEEKEGEEEDLDYELGKVDPQTKKAVRYVCDGCGEVQLEPFKCEICDKDAKKEELDVEERDGKWYIKGTKTQVVEKEPEEEEEEEAKQEKKEEGGKQEEKKGEGK